MNLTPQQQLAVDAVLVEAHEVVLEYLRVLKEHLIAGEYHPFGGRTQVLFATMDDLGITCYPDDDTRHKEMKQWLDAANNLHEAFGFDGEPSV